MVYQNLLVNDTSVLDAILISQDNSHSRHFNKEKVFVLIRTMVKERLKEKHVS